MKVETNVKAGARKCKLATPSQAKAYCNRMGKWDIAKINGPEGMAQYGPGYGCKQGMEKGGMGHALCQ